MYYIYCLTNKENGKKYIGQTNNIKRRMCQHKNDSFNPNCKLKYDTILAKAIRKYGWNSFELKILSQNEDKNKANETEIYYIEKFNSFNGAGYNASSGGEFGYIGRSYDSIVKESLLDIIEDLKSGMKHKDISKKYNISIPYVSGINNGTRLHLKDVSYPIFLSREKQIKLLYPSIISDLQNTDKPMSQIARDCNISKDTVQKINKGNIREIKKIFSDFPIRKK